MILLTLMMMPSLTCAQQTPHRPPRASEALLSPIDFSKAQPVNEPYRIEFLKCDTANTFKGVPMPGFRRCSNDPNNVKAFLRLDGGAIYFESKMGLDIDGSHKAWRNPGQVDQRTTWLTWKPGSSKQADQIDPDVYPFVVIPIAGLGDTADFEFRRMTGLDKGDFGVVVFNGRWTPVIVADGGPHNKLGEGSPAAFRAVGRDRCRRPNPAGWCESYLDASIERDVVTILFPGSRRNDLTPANALQIMRAEACSRIRLNGCP